MSDSDNEFSEGSPEEPPPPYTRVDAATGGPSPAGTSAGAGPTGAAASMANISPMLRLWVRVGGWFTTGLGFLVIVGALHASARYDWPFLIVAGLILMGASYALAGKAFSEGYSWPIPLVIFAPLTAAFFSWGLTLVAAAMLSILCIAAASEGALRTDSSEGSRLAFGLWLGGVVLILLHWALTF